MSQIYDLNHVKQIKHLRIAPSQYLKLTGDGNKKIWSRKMEIKILEAREKGTGSGGSNSPASPPPPYTCTLTWSDTQYLNL